MSNSIWLKGVDPLFGSIKCYFSMACNLKNSMQSLTEWAKGPEVPEMPEVPGSAFQRISVGT